MKVCFETFGCRLNRAEALEEEAAYLASGWKRTERHDEANIIIVRGCSVTARAQHDCEVLIDHLQRKYPNTPLIIRGCLVRKSDPPKSVFVPDESVLGKDGMKPVPTRTARAFLKVQDGCAGKCSFCIVPRFRGASFSVPFGEVIDKAKRFISSGYHEIVVTGCNLSLYCSMGKRLPELLDALADLGDCRIRLGSLEPSDCAKATVQVMADKPNCCHFLHVPVQSGSDLILQGMRRPYKAKDVEDLIASAHYLMPDCGIGCDIITGFPGETDLHFLATKGLIKRLPFSNAHIFPYSRRPDTPAANFPGQIPHNLRDGRARILADITDVKRKNFARSFIGKEVEVVIEDEVSCSGWTSQYLWFSAGRIAQGASEVMAPRKSRQRFRVTEVVNDRLRGVPI